MRKTDKLKRHKSKRDRGAREKVKRERQRSKNDRGGRETEGQKL